jgi:hypothetical protein
MMEPERWRGGRFKVPIPKVTHSHLDRLPEYIEYLPHFRFVHLINDS